MPDAAVARTHPAALAAWQDRRDTAFERIFRPSPKLSLSEWSDRYRYLSEETSAEPGRWRTSRVPYLREIMDAISDPEVQEVVLMKSARVGFTEGVIGNGIGYFIDQDPSPILVVQPSLEDARDWSRKQLAPMLRDTPRLAGKVAEAKGRDSSNTILDKSFVGGSLTIRGATSPKGLRRVNARVVFFDEIDGYPPSAGSEGDPISLGRKRADTFPDRKIVLGSTPLIKGLSRIERAFELTDQREYQVPCPHCNEYQALRWGGRDEAFGIKWEQDEDGRHHADTAYYLCAHCGAVIEEHHKPAMVRSGRWVPTNPDSSRPGWHLNALVSLFDGARWPVLIQEWLDAQGDNEELQVFVNTVLGETWEERGDTVTSSTLEARAESYVNAEGEPVDVPDGVGTLTAGVDVHPDRLELLIRGWGAEEESWGIAHHRIYGDVYHADTWARLETLLTKAYVHVSGYELRLSACMIDSGYATDAVYAFVAPREQRNVFASQGDAGRPGAKPLTRSHRKNRDGVKLFTIGTYTLKNRLFARLAVGRPGRLYMHFPMMREDRYNGFDAEFFAQFAAEKRVTRRKQGSRQVVRQWIQVRERNEAIDLEVLADVALMALGAGVREILGQRAEEARQGKSAKRAAAPRRRRRMGGGWIDGWKR